MRRRGNDGHVIREFKRSHAPGRNDEFRDPGRNGLGPVVYNAQYAARLVQFLSNHQDSQDASLSEFPNASFRYVAA